MSQAALACRGCLATDTKLFDFTENKLKESFMELIGCPFQEMESVRMPQYLCYYCNALLIKCVMFRDRCLRSQAVLELIDESDLTTAYIGSVDRDHYNLNLNLSISNPVIIDSDLTEEEMPIETLEDVPEEFAYEEYLEDEVKLEDDYDTLELADFEYDDMTTANNDDLSSGEKKKKPFSVHDFENRYNVTINVLTKEQQILEVYERKELSKKSEFGCNECGKTFINADKLRNHFMMSHDPNIGHFMCELCNNKYENRSKLRRHIFSHKYRFNCNDCPFNTMRLSSSKNHYFRHQGVQFCCDKCGKSFSMNTSYLSHLRKHHPSKYSWCRYCGESFLGDIGLRNHKKIIHYDVINSKHICQTCEMPFVSDEALQTHNGTNCSEHACFECGNSFEDKQFLRCHLISHHKKSSSSKSFKCGVCDVVFENAKSLNYHFVWSKGQCYGLRFCIKCGVHCATEADLVEHMTNVHEDKKFECVKCHRTFPNTTKLNLHTKQAHKRKKGETRRLVGTRQWRVLNTAGGDVIAGEGGFIKQEQRGEKNVCEFCGKPCPNIIALKIHRRVHTGERPYKCPICAKCFTTELLCTQHIRVHTGERPYKCLYCPKTFKSKPAVNRHMLIHTGERKHICTLCNKAFRTSTDVKTHIKYVHMKVPAQPRERKARVPKDERKHICMICNEAFLTSTEAKLHVKQAHMTAPPLPVVVSSVD